MKQNFQSVSQLKPAGMHVTRNETGPVSFPALLDLMACHCLAFLAMNDFKYYLWN